MRRSHLSRAFLGLHRFYWVGIRAGLILGRSLRLRFHQVRDLMIAVDGLLSAGFYLTLLATPAAMVLSVVTANPIPLLAALALALDVIFLALLRRERQLRRRHWLKRLWIYDIDAGSARTLRGRIGVGHVFLNQAGERYWTRKRVAAAMGRARLASRWIERRAEGVGVELELVDQVLSTRQTLPREPKLSVEGVEQAIAGDAVAYAAEVRRLDGGCLMVHVPYHTTSFALPDRLGLQLDLPVEWCLVTVYSLPGVMAHELLHLFGADDHYWSLTDIEHEAKRSLIGRSVMFDPDQPLSELRIDGVTAQNIGWI
jgi:hypothetical protein